MGIAVQGGPEAHVVASYILLAGDCPMWEYSHILTVSGYCQGNTLVYNWPCLALQRLDRQCYSRQR